MFLRLFQIFILVTLLSSFRHLMYPASLVLHLGSFFIKWMTCSMLMFTDNLLTVVIHYCYICFQPPRPLSQSDLEKVLATSKKPRVAAGEYSGLTSQSTCWLRSGDSDDFPVQAAIQELSKLVMSQVMNLQPDMQDPWTHTLGRSALFLL